MKKSTMIGIGIGAGALVAGIAAAIFGKKQDQAETEETVVDCEDMDSDVNAEE